MTEWRNHPLAERLEQRISQGKLDLPLLPHAAMRIVQMGDGNLRELTELIHRDPALAGHVMRVVNSPAFMARNPISTLQQAVTRLGFTRLREMALSLSLGAKLFAVPGYDDEAGRLWRHAVITSAYAKELARLSGQDGDAAFLGGLLHDLGKQVLLQALVELSGRVRLAPGWQELVHAKHTAVGAILADEWRLPADIRDAIEHHHAPERATDPVRATVIALADRLALVQTAPRAEEFEPQLRATLGISVFELGQFLARLDDITKQAHAL